MLMTAIMVALYIGTLTATASLTILNYEPNPDSNLALTVAAHILWPVTLCIFFIWLSLTLRSHQLPGNRAEKI